jgi:PAS domain S-box-containing protein
MQVPLTSQLLGDLIEKGYTHVLSSTSKESQNHEPTTIVLKPIREKPDLQNLPAGFETYYRITQEPLQMVCGIDNTNVLVEMPNIENEDYPGQEILDDSYFRMSEDFFRQVLDSLEDYAVFTINKSGEVNSWNSGAEKVLGHSEKEIIGINFAVFFTQEDIEKDEPGKELEKALKNGRSVDERFHVRKDKSTFWGSGLVFPLLDINNKHRGFTKIMRNLEEQKEAQRQAK